MSIQIMCWLRAQHLIVPGGFNNIATELKIQLEFENNDDKIKRRCNAS